MTKGDRIIMGTKSMGEMPDEDIAHKFFLQSYGAAGIKNGTVVYDPLGARGPKGTNLRPKIKDMFMKGFEAWDDGMRMGLDFDPALKEFQRAMAEERQLKSLLTTNWNIPIHALEVNIVTPGITPISALIPRIATDKKTVQSHPLTTIGAAAYIAESATAYTFNDDTYAGGSLSDYAFSMTGIGRGNDVSDLMMLTGGSVDNPAAVRAMAQLQAIRRFEETQIIQGQGGGSGTSFLGLRDFAEGTGGTDTNKATGVTWPTDLRIAIETVVDNGGNPETMFVVTSSTIRNQIADALQEFYRGRDPWKNFEVIASGINFKWRVLEFDGVPVFKSYGCGSGELYVSDFATHYMAEVQPPTFKPLAKTGPFDRGATDTWETMISEGYAHCLRYYNIP